MGTLPTHCRPVARLAHGLVVMLAVVLGADTARAADEAACVGMTINKRAIRGCETSQCRDDASQERLWELVELPIGHTLTQPEIDRSHRRLGATKLFRSTALKCSGGTLTIEVVPNTFVRNVRISGNAFFKDKDIVKRVFLRTGTVLNADLGRPRDNPDVERQIASLQRLYSSAGLEDVDISVALTSNGELGVDIEFLIAEGERGRVDQIRVRHERTGVVEADGLRCPRIPLARLERLTGLGYDDVWTSKSARTIRDRLKRAFQGAGFVRPKVEVTTVGDPLQVDVVVTTRQCWLVRIWERDAASATDASVPSFRMPDPIDRDADGKRPFARKPLVDWEETLPFATSGVFDRDEAVRGAQAMSELLRGRGFPFAEVSAEHREVRGPDGRRRSKAEVRGIIDYTITLNHERRLQGMRFVGRESYEEDELLKVVQTKPYDFFGSSGHFHPERVLFDLTLLKRYYRERGHYAFAYDLVGQPDDVTPSRETSASEEGARAWRYTFQDRGFLLRKRVGEMSLYLEIPFEEGPRSTITKLDVSGNVALGDAELKTLSGWEEGGPFGSFFVVEGRDRILRWYRDRGYLHATLTLGCVRRDAPDAACDPTKVVTSSDVELRARIEEGPQVFVAGILIRGAFETDRHTLVRDLPKPNEPLDQRRVDTAMRQMRELGIFNSVRIDIVGLEEDPPGTTATILVSVEETGYKYIDVAGGVRSIQRRDIDRVPRAVASVTGTLLANVDRLSSGLGRGFPLDIPDIVFLAEYEYLDLNVLGLGHQIRFPMAAGVSFSQFLRLASFNPKWVVPRPYDLPVRLELTLIGELDRVTDPLDRLEFGAEAALTWPVSETMVTSLSVRGGWIQLQDPDERCLFCLESSSVGFGSSLAREIAEETSVEAACDDDGPFNGACDTQTFRPQISTSLRWRWDTQDNPLHPSSGFSVTAATSLILAADRESRTIDFNSFLRWELSLRAAVELSGPILAFYARYGGSFSFDDKFLPPNERFTLGGGSGLRGFADDGVCRYTDTGELDPTCSDEFGGNVLINGIAELRIPLIRDADVWLATFFDFGALAEDHGKIYGSSFRFSAGFGFRWLIGGVLPLRVDLGFPVFGLRCRTLSEDGSCSARDDATAVHFEALYPF